ncbi:hypothetical protein HDE_10005 [Halotydeus destructor]|nr:hypothetical protein HDE_10005 [Halotydeus destructor]
MKLIRGSVVVILIALAVNLIQCSRFGFSQKYNDGHEFDLVQDKIRNVRWQENDAISDYYEISESRIHEILSSDQDSEEDNDQYESAVDSSAENGGGSSKENPKDAKEDSEYEEIKPIKYESHIVTKTSMYDGFKGEDGDESEETKPAKDDDAMAERTRSHDNDEQYKGSTEPDTSGSRPRQRVPTEARREYFSDYDYGPSYPDRQPAEESRNRNRNRNQANRDREQNNFRNLASVSSSSSTSSSFQASKDQSQVTTSPTDAAQNSNKNGGKDQISRSSYNNYQTFQAPSRLEYISTPVQSEIRRGYVETQSAVQFQPSGQAKSYNVVAAAPEPVSVRLSPQVNQYQVQAAPEPVRQTYTIQQAPVQERIIVQQAPPPVTQVRQVNIVQAAPEPPPQLRFVTAQSPPQVNFVQAAPEPARVQFVQQAPQPINIAVAAAPQPQQTVYVQQQPPPQQTVVLQQAPRQINVVQQAPQQVQVVQQAPQAIQVVQAPQPVQFQAAIIQPARSATVYETQAAPCAPVLQAATVFETPPVQYQKANKYQSPQNLQTFYLPPMPQKTRYTVQQVQFMPVQTTIQQSTSFSPATRTTIYETDHAGAYSNPKPVMVPPPPMMDKPRMAPMPMALPAPPPMPAPMTPPMMSYMPPPKMYMDTTYTFYKMNKMNKMNKLLKAPLLFAGKLLKRGADGRRSMSTQGANRFLKPGDDSFKAKMTQQTYNIGQRTAQGSDIVHLVHRQQGDRKPRSMKKNRK